MNSIVSNYFTKMDENFKTLADILGENNIEEEMIKIYNFIQSSAYPKKFLDNVEENYLNVSQNGFNTSIWYEIIMQKSILKLNECLQISNELVDICNADEIIQDKNGKTIFNENLLILQLLSDLKENNWDVVYDKLSNLTFEKWKACSKSENKEIAKNLRDEGKGILSDLSEIIYQPLIEINSQSKKLYNAICAIKSVLNDFDFQYSSEKVRKNMLDFNDAEHKVIELLSDKITGKKSNIAHELSKRYTEIMVDEYQDTNEIQDTLFKLLSKNEENIFMVGDVKQSIYKFRLADPTIFLEKYMNFNDAKTATLGEFRKVSLSKNFRSREEVLDSANFIFGNIMSKRAGGVDYKDDQKLYLGSNYPQNSNNISEFCLVDYDAIDTDESTIEVEARAIVNKIQTLIETQYQVFDKGLDIMRDANYSDIVILLRSTSAKAYYYKLALEKAGINVDFKEGFEKILGTPEVSNLISLCKVLDNYLLDIDLIAVMRSRIFNFSDEEITKIRLQNRDISVYENILSCNDDNCKELVQNIAKIKEYSNNNTIFKTIWYVINEFDLLAKNALMSNGKSRRNNILRFLDFVSTLDESMSIYDFVNFLERIDNKKATLPSGAKAGFSVKIMTMHSSKGLEFPVVFLADIAKEFNKNDLRNNVTLHNKLGIGLKYVDDDNIVSYSSLMQKAMRMELEDELTSEEMRILYVAMTRPCEKLFVMCTLKKADKAFEKWTSEKDILSCNSYHYWFGMNIAKLPSSRIFYEKFNITENVRINGDLPNYFYCDYINNVENIEIMPKTFASYNKFEFKEFNYKYAEESKIPSKLTATNAKKEEDKDNQKNYKKPKFLSEKKLSPTEKGIAHHLVMQFIKFENCIDLSAIKVEIKRLFDDKFITKAQFECISPYKINAFINSDIGDRLRKSDKVIREFKFSILAKASEYYDVKTDDKVLLQGVIDCMFIKDDKITIIDYKTDFVNEENISDVSKEHAIQLEIYSKAIEEIYKLKVCEKYLYYFKTESFFKI